MRISRSLFTAAFVSIAFVSQATAQGLVQPQRVFDISPARADAAGPGHPWQGPVSGMHPFSRARLTDIPFFGIGTRGGLGMEFSLHHDSKAVFSDPTLGAKWSHSFDTHIDVWSFFGTKRAALVWGDQRVQRFRKIGPVWTPSDGYRDELAAFGASFALTLHDRTRLEFEIGMLAGQSRHRLARILDANGNALTLAYSNGLLSSVTDPSGRVIVFVYDANQRLASVHYQVAAFDRTWTVIRDLGGRIDDVRWPVVTVAGVPSFFDVYVTVNVDENVTAVTDRSGRTWTTSYSPSDRNAVATLTAPGSSQPILVETPAPSSTRITDEVGVSTTYAYDSLARLVSSARSSETLTLAYLDPDFAWAPSSIVTGSGTQWQYDYDARGNVVGAVDPAGQRTDFAWNPRNNLTQVQEPLVTDAWGLTEPARHRHDYVYDAHENLIQARDYLDATTFLTTTLAYDGFGECTAITDPNMHTAQLAHDAYGNVILRTSPAGRTTQWLYESADETFGFALPNAVIDGNGQRGDLVRDEWGRVVSESFPDGSGAQYAYDGEDRRVHMADPFAGTTDWTYSARGLSMDELNGPAIVHCDYAPNGSRSHLAHASPTALRNLTYAYDPLDRLMDVSENGLTTHFDYEVDGRWTRRTSPSGAREERTYAQGRLASLSHYSATNVLLASFTYAYQENGLVRSVSESGGALTRYGYDFLDRLIREERTGSTPYVYTWTYDGAGNRSNQVKSGVLTTFLHDPDDLVQQSQTGANPPDVFLWDGAARMTMKGHPGSLEQFGYDYIGRMRSISRFSGSGWIPSLKFDYDGLDRRIRRTSFDPIGIPQVTSTYSHDGDAMLDEDRIDSVNGPAHEEATWAKGLVRWHDKIAGHGQWPATDGVGSLRKLISDSGQLLAYTGIFDALGETVVDSGTRPPFACLGDFGDCSDVNAEGIVDQADLYVPDLGQTFAEARWWQDGQDQDSGVSGLGDEDSPSKDNVEPWPTPPEPHTSPFNNCIGNPFEAKPWGTKPAPIPWPYPGPPGPNGWLDGFQCIRIGKRTFSVPMYTWHPGCYFPPPAPPLTDTELLKRVREDRERRTRAALGH